MIYFDNAATTYPKPKILYKETMNLYEKIGVNASRGRYVVAEEMNILLNDLKMNLRKLFRCKQSVKVILNSSSTISLNQIIQGLDYSSINNVYISPFEHNSVYRPLLAMQKKYEFKIIQLPFDEFEWNENKTKLFFSTNKPDVVICTHASNVFGNILPIEEIFRISKEYNSINILDAAQTAGLLDIDANKMNIDFLAFAGHKSLYGPTGIGGFVYNSDKELSPILFGGTGINSEEEEMPNSIPERFEIGSLNSLGVIGLKLSTDWVLGKGLENIRKRERDNLILLENVLKDFEEIKFKISEESIGIISATFDNYSPGEMAEILSDYGVAIRSGLHCSPLSHKHKTTFPNGTVRFSVGYFNKNEDFDDLKKILEELL